MTLWEAVTLIVLPGKAQLFLSAEISLQIVEPLTLKILKDIFFHH